MADAAVDTWWNRTIVEPGKVPLLVGFAAFVITFVTTRSITRLIRAGRGPFSDNVSSTGVHVHHAVPGIIGLVVGGFMAIASPSDSVWRDVAAVLVGLGTSLVLDEFALILHLEDVYWSDEGRLSVEMVSLAFGCLGFTLVGVAPFGINQMGSQEVFVRVGAVATIVITLALVVICVLKGKLKMALFGVFIPLLTVVGALRLARPNSTWARRLYGPKRIAQAKTRTAKFDARVDPALDRISDAVAGKPSAP